LKKNIAILFLSVYLVSTTEIHQLLKLPFLVEHYFEHRDMNKSLTLGQFLTMHYSGQDIKYADEEKDMKLPFKTNDGCINASIAPFIPAVHLIAVPKTGHTIPRCFTLYKEKNNHSFYLASIWQPPRHC
jgi:hypothetical protein